VPAAKLLDRVPFSLNEISGRLMLRILIQRFHRGNMDSKVREALESGVGLYHGHWRLRSKEEAGLLPEEVSLAILDWCRAAMGQMRRPYGLDYVTFALAVLGPEDEEIARASFGVLRPSDFYSDGPAPQRLNQVITEWRSGTDFRSARSLSAVMFSWGDITRELLLAG
jgi:hypothetical protein